MPLTTNELKACFLVGYKVSVHGGIHYSHRDEQRWEDGSSELAKWQTEKEIKDAAEYKRAQALRNKAKRYMRKLGVPSELGVMVPVEDAADIERVYLQLQVEVDRFNAEAQYSEIHFRVLKFKIEGENELALQDMLQDMRRNLVELKQAVKKANVKGIRDVIWRMKGMEMVLPESAADYVERAVADAKAQAIEMRKALEERNEDLDAVQKRTSTDSLDYARFAPLEPGSDLLDVDNEFLQGMVERDALKRGAGVPLGDDEDEEGAAPEAKSAPQDAPEALQANGGPLLNPIFGDDDLDEL